MTHGYNNSNNNNTLAVCIGGGETVRAAFTSLVNESRQMGIFVSPFTLFGQISRGLTENRFGDLLPAIKRQANKQISNG